jgi:hypothetical protein
MKNRIRIVRQPWTSDISDMLESRVYELYLNQKFPQVQIDYVGGDFPLSQESEQGEIRNVVLFGNLSHDPLNLLDLQPYICMISGVKIGNERGKIRECFTAELLFKSETFRREFSSTLLSTRDKTTKVFLENFGIESFNVSNPSILLGLIKDPIVSIRNSLDYLFVDLNQDLLFVLQNKILLKESSAAISTKIPEIHGELDKNLKADSYFALLRAAKIVITANSFFAYAAHSLSKEVIFVANVKTDEIAAIGEGELIEGLRTFDISRFSNTLPKDTISKSQDSLEHLIERSLNYSDGVRLPYEAQAYKNQVIAEIVDSISKSLFSSNAEVDCLKSIIVEKNSELENIRQQQSIILESTAWRITAPLRKVIGFLSKVKQLRPKPPVEND